MFWKYWFAALLCCLIAWFMRKFLCTKEYISSEEERRIPRIWTIFLILVGFIPIVNYVFAAIMIIFLGAAYLDGDALYMREEPFKNKKLQKWLLGRD